MLEHPGEGGEHELGAVALAGLEHAARSPIETAATPALRSPRPVRGSRMFAAMSSTIASFRRPLS